MACELVVELAAAATDPALGLLADPRDLGLRPVLDACDVLVGARAECAGVRHRATLDLLDVCVPVDPELLEGRSTRLLGSNLHRMCEVGQELRRPPGGLGLVGRRRIGEGRRRRRAGFRGPHGLGRPFDRRIDNGGRLGLARCARVERRFGIERVDVGSIGSVGPAQRRARIGPGRLVEAVAGQRAICAPREPEAGSRFGGRHATRSLLRSFDGHGPSTRCGA